MHALCLFLHGDGRDESTRHSEGFQECVFTRVTKGIFLVLEKPKVKNLIHKNCWKNVSRVSVSFFNIRSSRSNKSVKVL